MIHKQELHEKGTKQKTIPLRACLWEVMEDMCALSTTITIHCLGEVKLCCAMGRMKKHSTKAVTQLNNNSRDHRATKGVLWKW